MRYVFIRDGKEEEVQLEKWCWRAVYADGSILQQFGDDGIFHQVGEIEQEKVRIFCMYPSDGSGPGFDLVVPKGGKVLHKYRQYVFHAEKEKKMVKIYVFGYKMGNHYHYNFIMPDGRLIQSIEENIYIEK